MPKPNIKVAIKSCHKHAARRQNQQETWLRHLDADFFYLIGNPTPQNGGPTLPEVLSCDVSDEFENIAPKIKVACRYALDENADFLFVCDDDTYVRPDRLLRSGFIHGDYIGFMRTSGLDYNKGVPYAQGSAYWLSARAMELVVLSSVMQNGIIDDGAVGQALVDKVPFTHDWRYEPGPHPIRRPLPENNLITTHKCHSADLMQSVHLPFTRNTGTA